MKQLQAPGPTTPLANSKWMQIKRSAAFDLRM